MINNFKCSDSFSDAGFQMKIQSLSSLLKSQISLLRYHHSQKFILLISIKGTPGYVKSRFYIIGFYMEIEENIVRFVLY